MITDKFTTFPTPPEILRHCDSFMKSFFYSAMFRLNRLYRNLELLAAENFTCGSVSHWEAMKSLKRRINLREQKSGTNNCTLLSFVRPYITEFTQHCTFSCLFDLCTQYLDAFVNCITFIWTDSKLYITRVVSFWLLASRRRHDPPALLKWASKFF